MSTGREAVAAVLGEHAKAGVVLGEGVGAAGLALGVAGVRTPLSEAGSVGVALGFALAGRRPVVEIIDLAGVARAAEALGEAVDLPARSGGAFAAPVVILAVLPAGAAVPTVPSGMDLYVAGTPDDTSGLLAAALKSNRVALVLVDEGALDEPQAGAVDSPGPVVRRAGTGATVLAEGAGVSLALSLPEGPEVVDLRGCRDVNALAGLAARTGRVVFCGHADPRVIAAVVSGGFWRLEAPPLFVAAAAGLDALQAAITESLTP